MKFNKISKELKRRKIKEIGSYDFPKYKISGTKSFYFGGIFGVRGGGKTTAMLNIIDIEKDIMLKGANKVYFISPTCDSKVQHYIDKYPDNFCYIDELNVKNLDDTMATIKEDVEKWKAEMELIDLLTIFLHDPKKLDEADTQKLEECNYLESYDFDSINTDHPPISTLCIDDSMSSPLISSSNSKQGKHFLKFALKHRHSPHYCNIFIMAQHIKTISKPLRVNMSMIALFPFRDQNVLKTIFDEYSGLYDHKLKNFLDLIDEVEKRKDHSFILMYQDTMKFVRINFDENVKFDD
jgi:hypothetical protein